MAKQVQIRRDTASNINATTPAQGELGYDITNKRLRAGDGSTAGGTIFGNAYDAQNKPFEYAAAGGTANAITLTLSPAPASLTAGLTVKFKASNNNTTATTLNVNGLGDVNLYKKSGGSVGALDADDIIQDGTYTATYDGTQWQLEAAPGSSILSISQGDLNTSTSTISGGNSNGTTIGAMGGGEYAFGVRCTTSNASRQATINIRAVSTSYTRTYEAWDNSGGGATITIRERYITSSPPFDLGDGNMQGFLFLKLNPAGEIIGHYLADVPPWAYNGPTDIKACGRCPITREKVRRVMKKRSLEELMDGAKIEYEYEIITQALKNADMGLIPHPFIDCPDAAHVVLVDPMDERIGKLLELQNAGGDDEIVKALYDGKIYTEDIDLKRKGPIGVKTTPLRFKYSGLKDKKK